jgi:hypothetical protein
MEEEQSDFEREEEDYLTGAEFCWYCGKQCFKCDMYIRYPISPDGETEYLCEKNCPEFE